MTSHYSRKVLKIYRSDGEKLSKSFVFVFQHFVAICELKCNCCGLEAILTGCCLKTTASQPSEDGVQLEQVHWDVHGQEEVETTVIVTLKWMHTKRSDKTNVGVWSRAREGQG